jgi:para-nitrobenzyl esterase
LFHRAVLQSGGLEPAAAMPDSARERVIQASTQLFEQLGGSDIEHLRTVPLDQVRQASRVLSGTRPAPGQVHTPANLVWCPTPDGQVVGADLSCWPADMPVLFGRTEHEARYFITPSGPYGAPGVDPASIYTPPPSRRWLRSWAASEPTTSWLSFSDLGRTAYAYRFTRVSPGNRRTGILAHHCAELPYLFGHLAPTEQYDEVDARVSDTVQYAWTEFARTGVPRNPDGTPWPAGTTTTPLLTVIDDASHSRPLDISPVAELINSMRTDADEVVCQTLTPKSRAMPARPEA